MVESPGKPGWFTGVVRRSQDISIGKANGLSLIVIVDLKGLTGHFAVCVLTIRTDQVSRDVILIRDASAITSLNPLPEPENVVGYWWTEPSANWIDCALPCGK